MQGEKTLTLTFKESSYLQYTCERHISRTAGWRESCAQHQLKAQSVARNTVCASFLQLVTPGVSCSWRLSQLSWEQLPRLCSIICRVTLLCHGLLPFVVSDGFRTRQRGFWQGWRLQLVSNTMCFCVCMHSHTSLMPMMQSEDCH